MRKKVKLFSVVFLHFITWSSLQRNDHVFEQKKKKKNIQDDSQSKQQCVFYCHSWLYPIKMQRPDKQFWSSLMR